MILRLLGATALSGMLITGAAAQEARDPLEHVLTTIAAGETGNDPDAYSALYGGGHFKRFGFPDWPGKMGPEGISHAAGRCQFQPGTWVKAAQAFIAAGNPVPDFNNPADQDAVCKFWAASIYQRNTGRSLAADAELERVEWNALADEWTSLRSKPATVVRKVARTVAQNTMPVAPPQGAEWSVLAPPRLPHLQTEKGKSE